jgi:predicted nuclease of predicted toxin-antitoxin system
MKFLVDAHLPFRLVRVLKSKGLDAKHTDEMPRRERSRDREIRSVAQSEERIVITKDSDFLDSHLVNHDPKKLLLVSTGNVTNRILLELFEGNLLRILEQFQHHDLLELTNTEVIIHE